MKEICIGILAHVDAGKTTCIESFFSHTGVIRSRGRVDHGDSVFDNDPKEREHGITIYSKEAGITWKDTRINVIDTSALGLPVATVRIACSKGTYIRALARDIGQALQSGAYLTSLLRTRVGDMKLDDCLDPREFETWLAAQEVSPFDEE